MMGDTNATKGNATTTKSFKISTSDIAGVTGMVTLTEISPEMGILSFSLKIDGASSSVWGVPNSLINSKLGITLKAPPSGCDSDGWWIDYSATGGLRTDLMGYGTTTYYTTDEIQFGRIYDTGGNVGGFSLGTLGNGYLIAQTTVWFN